MFFSTHLKMEKDTHKKVFPVIIERDADELSIGIMITDDDEIDNKYDDEDDEDYDEYSKKPW